MALQALISKDVQARLRGELRFDEPMAQHVSWRAGGKAAVWFRPADMQDLQEFVSAWKGPLLTVGLGSNLLIRDGGWPGAVVNLYDTLAGLDLKDDGKVSVQAGVHCATLASRCAKLGINGATFFGGIPGTVGGALAMNAGAWGGETWDVVRRVTTLSPAGTIQEWERDAFTVGYRHVEMPAPGLIFLQAQLQLQPGQNATQLQAELKQMLAERRAKQPVGKPSCGSVFRNPDGNFAAALIESCGLKGSRLGEAEVSEKHANFILNRGQASAADIEGLIQQVQSTVESQTGYRLQPEVRIVGETA